MPSWIRCLALALVSTLAMPLCWAQEWSEAQIIEQFQALSPQAREARALVAVAQAEARARTVYSNPSVSYSREGAGFTEFFQATQTLPISGHLRYLRNAGTAAVAVADANREALLWSLRSDLRLAFYQMLAAQERVRLLTASIGEMDRLIRVLRHREDEGEGSRYDRMRAEREAAELRTDLSGAQARVASASAQLAGFLPENAVVHRVTGVLLTTYDAPSPDDLVKRAFAARADYRAAMRSLSRYQLEEEAARRLRISEPSITAGVKRADLTSGSPPNPFADVTRTGWAFGISVPLPLFNHGQYEVTRFQTEQDQARAQMARLERQIRTEIQGARDVLTLRKEALQVYEREVQSTGSELTRITEAAYQEGEVGILELLDSQRINRLASLRLLDLQAGLREAFIQLDRAVGEEVHP